MPQLSSPKGACYTVLPLPWCWLDDAGFSALVFRPWDAAIQQRSANSGAASGAVNSNRGQMAPAGFPRGATVHAPINAMLPSSSLMTDFS